MSGAAQARSPEPSRPCSIEHDAGIGAIRDAVGARPIVVKMGGAALERPSGGAGVDGWALDVARLAAAGTGVVVVHGGGPELGRTLERLGTPTRFVDGQRVTTPAIADAASMVLSGLMNQRVVATLVAAGVRAIGLSGADCGHVRTSPAEPALGRVGYVDDFDPRTCLDLIGAGYVPVLSSTTVGDDLAPVNVNADHLAGAVAAGVRAGWLALLSDVRGVRLDGEVAARLERASASAAIRDGRASGGMIPKLRAADAALEAGVPRATVALGSGPSPLTAAWAGSGTDVIPTVDAVAAAARDETSTEAGA